VKSPYLDKTTTTHIKQSNAATTTNIPTTTTTPVGQLVNPIFTHPLTVVVFCAAYFALLVKAVVVVKQQQRRKHNWLIVVSSPSPPLPDNQNALPSSWLLGPVVVMHCCLNIEHISLLGGSSSSSTNPMPPTTILPLLTKAETTARKRVAYEKTITCDDKG
jgi:hypothetical protein